MNRGLDPFQPVYRSEEMLRTIGIPLLINLFYPADQRLPQTVDIGPFGGGHKHADRLGLGLPALFQFFQQLLPGAFFQPGIKIQFPVPVHLIENINHRLVEGIDFLQGLY